MAQEREIKVLLKIPSDDFLTKLKKFGFTKEITIEQTDRYFDTKNWDLYKNVAALRIRSVNDIEKELTYKKLFYMPVRNDPWYVEEIESAFPAATSDSLGNILRQVGVSDIPVRVENFSEIKRILKESDFQDDQVMKKTRETYKLRDNELTLDTISELGIIIELECKTDEPTELIQEILQPIEWERSTEGTSYLWLEKKYGFTKHKSYTDLFKRQPSWNVSPGEEEWYASKNKGKF